MRHDKYIDLGNDNVVSILERALARAKETGSAAEVVVLMAERVLDGDPHSYNFQILCGTAVSGDIIIQDDDFTMAASAYICTDEYGTSFSRWPAEEAARIRTAFLKAHAWPESVASASE